ncbi:MAG TPA: helix-turn-helix transcriptional regulator [Parvularculaceae bacterium]|nr:helix-turn-helix transcriptional regulator [Amphiplicatus sp.]HPE30244.1 helix-turn-helix transcriptional regulator [Parvularculaceae bacterium]HRX38245.1 helix-turn-helix transcriptional regulator [Parvularculaceae bacterium]
MMKINALTPEPAILKELGERLARIRKQQGLAQTDLAEEAGVGVATLRRIEGGQDSQLESWLKLLKALDMTFAIDALLPENFNSPMAEARGAARKRSKLSEGSAGIVWGDETP